jgi:predicted transcriptional regulator of viral defense system
VIILDKRQQIERLLAERKGIIKLSEVVDAGISKQYFGQYASEESLERVARGIYATAQAWLDDMYILQLRYPHAIFSHETALYLHGLNDREPTILTVTVKSGYNATLLRKQRVKVYSLPEEKYSIGATEANTMFQHLVKVYNTERTICDILRNRNEIEIQDLTDSIKTYARSREKNLPLLMRYAELFGVEKQVRTYMEVLL